jgi:hypothetical protein
MNGTVTNFLRGWQFGVTFQSNDQVLIHNDSGWGSSNAAARLLRRHHSALCRWGDDWAATENRPYVFGAVALCLLRIGLQVGRAGWFSCSKGLGLCEEVGNS